METADLSPDGWADNGYAARLSIILPGPNEEVVIVEVLTCHGPAPRRPVIFRIDKNMRRLILDVGDPYGIRTGAR